MKHTVESYLSELEARLSPLPEEKRKEIIREYRSHLETAAAEGVSARDSLKALKSPIRLADAVLRTHGVFAQAEKWQVRWLAVYCCVVAGLTWYWLKMSVGPMRLQPIPLYLFISTLWGFGCLPYYVACFQSRRFLSKPFLGATILITAIFWGNFAIRSRIIQHKIESSYVSTQLTRTNAKDLKEFGEAVQKISGYSPTSGMGHFSWMYDELKPVLNRGAHLVVAVPMRDGFLAPDSSGDNEQPVKFAVISDQKSAVRLWDENKDRLNRFARNAVVISEMKAMNDYPVRVFHIRHLPGMLRYASYIVLPLGLLGILSSSLRPVVRRPRGVA
jgi:hypothetical protein